MDTNDTLNTASHLQPAPDEDNAHPFAAHVLPVDWSTDAAKSEGLLERRLARLERALGLGPLA